MPGADDRPLGGTVAGSRPIAVDLFAGAGGLSLGLEQAGYDVALAVEYDPVHALTHRFNSPACRVLCRDVHRLAAADLWAELALARPERVEPGGRVAVDLVAGGPSCQGFSTGGTRDHDDERNDLLGEFVRLVLEVRPAAFLLENVPGLLEPRFEVLRSRASGLLVGAGYQVAGMDGHVDACDFGVPQHRKRVIVTGVLEGPAVTLRGAGPERVTVAEALEGLPTVEGYAELLDRDVVVLTGPDRARRKAALSSYARTLSGLDADPTDRSAPRDWSPAQVTNSLRTVHSAAVVERFMATAQGSAEPVSRFHRLAADRPARTLRAGTGRERGSHTAPRPIHPTVPRVVTVREAARLHGYPDWFRFAGTNWHGHRQVGNSVPPPLARAAGLALLGGSTTTAVTPDDAVRLGDPAWLTTSPSEAARLLGARATELPPARSRLETGPTPPPVLVG